MERRENGRDKVRVGDGADVGGERAGLDVCFTISINF